MEGYLMRVDKGSKEIMNLDSISDFGESWCIKCRFVEVMSKQKSVCPVAIVSARITKFKKSYLTQF